MEPLFSKLLTTTDVQKRLAIPASCLKHFPSYESKYSVPLPVEDETGNVWNFDCPTRKASYPKPAFCKGWRHFVNSRGMCVGDRVVFYKDVEADVYRIKVQRKIKLFGQDCWSNPPPADQQGVNSELRQKQKLLKYKQGKTSGYIRRPMKNRLVSTKQQQLKQKRTKKKSKRIVVVR